VKYIIGLISILSLFTLACNNSYTYYSDNLKDYIKVNIYYGNEPGNKLSPFVELGGIIIKEISVNPISTNSDYNTINLVRMTGYEKLFLLIDFKDADLVKQMTSKERCLIFEINGKLYDAARVTFNITNGKIPFSINLNYLVEIVPKNRLHVDRR
jgi:hypothetical protein